MRLLSVTVLGSALVAAGLLAPATGQATTKATGRGGVAIEPGVARAGDTVSVSAPGCGGGRHRASSEAFGRQVRLDGSRGTAVIDDDAKPGTYLVRVRCGSRTASGTVRVAGRLAWPALLPGARDGL
ncbi:hypothetical protein [Actinomadura opuntiae]|uniref:hypothetical protein n=1 Tax=Actinomadura sp. OS1-43 TaxID=604315 RepID=UPI00255A9486|nr:hypothetical protein [Actinomadura sp. OS1-43]MDL4821229.1 hypothetical protein [Actinomadura sp. OS1-43]